MASSERVAIAAHLHVALRRKAGRVTDTEWMASNDEYAREIVRVARAKAQEDGDDALAELANKLALLLQPGANKAPSTPLVARVANTLRPPPLAPSEPEDPNRYIGGLR